MIVAWGLYADLEGIGTVGNCLRLCFCLDLW